MIRKDSYRSINILNADKMFDLSFTKEGYPQIRASNEIPLKIIPFDKCMRSKDFDAWVHFFIEDYQFERIWSKPKTYIKVLEKFKGVISPDFSVYYDMPIHMKRWNIYRNKFLSSYMQLHGINVIPNIQIVKQDLWDDIINGIEEGGVIAVGCTGIKKRYFARQMLYRQIEYVVDQLSPKTILCYGNCEILSEYENVIYFGNNHLERIRNVQRDRITKELQ